MTAGPLDLLQPYLRRVTVGGLLVLLGWSWRRQQAKPADDGTPDGGPETCGHCGYDVRGGLERCPECGRPTPAARRSRLAELRTRWPTEAMTPRTPSADETPVVVLVTDEAPAAELLRQHLEARGVAARTAGPQPIGHAAYQQVMGSHRLVVWSDDADRARAIIDRLWGDVNG